MERSSGRRESGTRSGGVVEHRDGREFRVAGRTLSGVAMLYGDVSPDFRERFVPGAFGAVPATIPTNLQHDPSIIVAERAMLTDGPRELRVRADLPAGSAALALVTRGTLNSFSVEFHAKAERREGGVRVIERAELTGLALVDVGAYRGATAEVRARSGRRLRSSLPYNESLACECIAQGRGGAECVALARFRKHVGEVWAEEFDIIRAEVEDGIRGRDILAVHKDYSRPLGSARRGTLRAVDDEGELTISIDLPTGAAGDAVVDASEIAGVVVRPLVDDNRSRYVDGPEGRVYEEAHLRAFLVGSTDARAGWPDAVIDYDGEGRAAPAPARRRRLWL